MLDQSRGFDRFPSYDSRPFGFNQPQRIPVTLFTDAHIIKGVVETRMRRLSDVLNQADNDFLVLGEASMEELGSSGEPTRAEYAQVNLASLLFAVTDAIVEPQPELRLVKSAEQALIVVPPFKIVGRIHVLPGRDLREALAELTGRFIPVTEPSFWSDAARQPKMTASFVAFNRARAHVLASHHDRDPWQGLGGKP